VDERSGPFRIDCALVVDEISGSFKTTPLVVDERPGTVKKGKGYRISVEIYKYKRNRDEKKGLLG
jgi:hypothetical protein